MFKKIFGPKKIEGVGTPVPTEELRTKILEFFPQEGEINKYLSIEGSKDSPDGFNAVWKLYARDRDNEGIRRNYLITHTVKVLIDPKEHAVTLKSKHFARTARVPKDETLHESWVPHVKIGRLDEVQASLGKKFQMFSFKKASESLVEYITQNGWDAYR